MYSEEITFLKALRDATHRGLIIWNIVPDDDKDIQVAEVDGDTIEIEHMWFTATGDQTAETILAYVRGMKTYFKVSAGTEAYHLITEIQANRQALESSKKKLNRAIARVQKLID